MTDSTICTECDRKITMQCFMGTGVCCELCRKSREAKTGAIPVDVEGVVVPPKHFRKKPVIFEAVQLRWETWNDVCAFVGDNISPHTPGWSITAEEASDTCGEPGPNYIAFSVTTGNGEPAVVRHGDWILPDGKLNETLNAFTPCKPDLFAAAYEEVNKHGDTFPPATPPLRTRSDE